jgi:hypothetical protein
MWLMLFTVYMSHLWKERLNSDGQQSQPYQQKNNHLSPCILYLNIDSCMLVCLFDGV